jgi:hypothetical protein
LPATRFFQYISGVCPRGVIAPIPVTTTLFLSIFTPMFSRIKFAEPVR